MAIARLAGGPLEIIAATKGGAQGMTGPEGHREGKAGEATSEVKVGGMLLKAVGVVPLKSNSGDESPAKVKVGGSVAKDNGWGSLIIHRAVDDSCYHK